jgi:hypothetical protein
MSNEIGEAVGKNSEKRTFENSLLLPNRIFTGVEIEVEGLDIFYMDSIYLTWWKIKEDGTLRNGPTENLVGRELVLKVPLFGKDLEDALHEARLFFINNPKKEVVFSSRTSVHIHVDVRDMSPVSFYNFLVLYIVLEKFIIKNYFLDREKNPYCIPLYLASSNYLLINKTALKNCDIENIARSIQGNLLKYSAFNLGALSAHGSIEFRHMEGTCEVSRIIKWINFLHALKKYATTRYEMYSHNTLLNIKDETKNKTSEIYKHLLLLKNVSSLSKDDERYIEMGILQAFKFISTDYSLSLDNYSNYTPILDKYSKKPLGKPPKEKLKPYKVGGISKDLLNTPYTPSSNTGGVTIGVDFSTGNTIVVPPEEEV